MLQAQGLDVVLQWQISSAVFAINGGTHQQRIRVKYQQIRTQASFIKKNLPRPNEMPFILTPHDPIPRL